MILNIETSSKKCSVALSEEGAVLFSLESENDMDHSSKLAPYIDKCLEELYKRDLKLDAVAVSMGPGSYTGLRIGLSLAKGLCFGLKIPLIGVSTLKVLAVKAMFFLDSFVENPVYIPMIDARRMEVYTAAFNNALETLMNPTPLVLDETSYESFASDSVILIGDAVEKAREVLKIPVLKWIQCYPEASDMIALSEKAFREKDFIDLAYSTPYYLKNFQATTPRKNIFC